MEEVIIRPMEQGDVNFVLSTWLRSYFYSIRAPILSWRYYAWQEERIRAVWKNPQSSTSMACLKEDPNVILGYLVQEERKDLTPIIHFCYVKKPFRSEGIFKTLLKAASLDLNKKVFFTHLTEDGIKILRKYPELFYAPDLMPEPFNVYVEESPTEEGVCL